MKNDYSLLRPFDAEAAKRGEPICNKDGEMREFASGPDKNGCISTMNSGVLLLPYAAIFYRMAPLGWCEGRPVYAGDKLWHKTTGLEASRFYKGDALSNFSWTPPAPKTKKVKLLAWITPSGLFARYEDGSIHNANGTWKRVPSEDKEVEVEE